MDTTIFPAAKLTIPTPVRTMVARPHLVEGLRRPGYRIGVVSAPAGFGKTALLATWAADQGDSVAWLSCDANDTEPTRFWRGLLAAVATQQPGVGDDASVLLERESAESPEIAISLANDLAAIDVPMTIVVDDLHLANPSSALLEGLTAALPATVRLLIGSRVDPPLPMGRLRVAGTLLELYGDDLSFSRAETAAVLEANGVALDPSALEVLHDLTEGWPAGVQLAALALERESERSEFLNAFAATDRAVADFLVGEVLDRQPEALVDFLHATSVLDGFDAALCEAVTGRADAGELLRQLVAANLFVVRLDVGAGWYRYHHLFGAFLQARLRASGQSCWRDAQLRAAHAYEDRNDIVNALHHAAASGEDEESANIVKRTLWRWINTIDPDATNAVVRQWLHRRGHALLITDPAQVLEFLVPLIATAPGDEVRWWLTQIEAAHAEPSATLQALLHGCWAEHHLCRGEAEDAVRHAVTALDAIGWAPPADGPLAALPTVVLRAHLQGYDAAGARGALDALEGRHTGHAVVDTVRIPAVRAWTAFLEGELRQSEHAAASALGCADQLDLPPSDVGRIFARLSLLGVRVERQDDGSVPSLLDEVRRDADLSGRPPLQSLVAFESARLARVLGDESKAADDLTLARSLLPTASPAVASTFDLEAARQAVHFRPLAAASLIDALEVGPAATLLRVRLALADGDASGAAVLLAALPAPTTPRDCVARSVLRALALLPRDVDAANVELHEGLLAAQPEGFRRSIIGQGPEVLKLLLSFTPTASLEPYVDGLIEAASSAAPPARPRPTTSLVEPLSEREVTVLRYLCSRLTYQEIASAIFVSHNTMKTHVSSVYRKLAVGSRREAVAAGRALQII